MDSVHQSTRPADAVHCAVDDVDFTDHADLFSDTSLFPSTCLDDTDLLRGLSMSSELLEDCELSLMHAGTPPLVHAGSLDPGTLQRLSEAGIQQPVERQIRLHADLAQHLSTSPPSSCSPRADLAQYLSTSPPSSCSPRADLAQHLSTSPPSSCSPRADLAQYLSTSPSLASSSPDDSSELVRMLTALEDDVGGAVEFVENVQHVPVVSPSAPSGGSAATSPTDSELARQLSLSSDGSRAQQQRVALVLPTVATPWSRVQTDNTSSQLVSQQSQPPSSTLPLGQISDSSAGLNTSRLSTLPLGQICDSSGGLNTSQIIVHQTPSSALTDVSHQLPLSAVLAQSSTGL